jgi:predicted dehydrogenase/threonine dehydrogenase-like Zn-dependent dehydrogenase
VHEVLNKVRRDGLLSTITAVRSRLDQPAALGYSSAGTVVGVGEGVTDLQVGDRVACAGAGYAVHAEFACVPRLLVAKIAAESQVGFDEAAFTTVGAVALHGIRTAEAKLGDVVAVIGLGLLGQLTTQLLKAAGCRVLGMDIVADRAALALRLGAEGAASSTQEFRDLCIHSSAGHGVDSVLVTAEAPSSDPVNLAGEVARDRAIVVAVGTVGMDIKRPTFYGKELDFRISRSYGPGRYDAAYEQQGRDYPIGYVRWTETRNMEAFLHLLGQGTLDLKSLITHRFPIEKAHEAYDVIRGKAGGSSLGVVITYSASVEEPARLELVKKPAQTAPAAKISVGLIGAGSFATSVLLPAMKQVDAIDLAGVSSATGAHSLHAARKFGFRYCTTQELEILEDPTVNTIAIATRHHLHASQVLAALAAGKHVFCEKPLCLREDELSEIVSAVRGAQGRQLLVGFNRRFAPMAVRMKQFVSEIREPLMLHYRVNAGHLPADHWINDPNQGGGRIIGEVCHFIDFLTFLAGALPIEVETRSLAGDGRYSADNVAISLTFANGSHGTIHYLANGDRSFSKERVEIFGGGTAAVLEDFRRLELVRGGHKQVFRSRWHQDKGHRGEWQAFADATRIGNHSPIPLEEIVSTTLTTLRAVQSQLSGGSEPVDTLEFINQSSRRFDS